MTDSERMTVDDSGGPMSKPKVTFKLKGGPLKLKETLQQSTVNAFDDSASSLDSFKKKLFKPSGDNWEETTKSEDKHDSRNIYTEPPWSSLPQDACKLDVLKSGMISNTFDLSNKNFYLVGNSLTCDIHVNHETVSQSHAVLQYGRIAGSEDKDGFYIYDLNSRHGTYLNDERIHPHTYIPLGGGHILTFGSCQRKYILVTSKENQEREAELSAVELQALKNLEWEEHQRIDQETLARVNKSNGEGRLEGINWGITEDLDESSKLTNSSENSECASDELFVNDPKKALRDWFKWEGYNVEYYTEDRGFGRYSCSIDLTLDAAGTTKTVEVVINGDRMKAIDECALEACQYLNKFGLLKKALEEKKSTLRNWEEVDYYDSEEDNFLDRTGVVEKKRHQRMKVAGKFNAQTETHNSLVKKYSEITDRIKHLEGIMTQQSNFQRESNDSEEDTLDAFMTKLKSATPNKTELLNIRIELQNLYQEKNLLQNSINVIRKTPTNPSKSQSTITEKTKNGCRYDH